MNVSLSVASTLRLCVCGCGRAFEPLRRQRFATPTCKSRAKKRQYQADVDGYVSPKTAAYQEGLPSVEDVQRRLGLAP